jgi:hypothetical protein
MSNFQRYARFHLIVAVTTLIVVLALLIIPATSQGYLAGFSLLSLLGFGEVYFQRPERKPIEDERDEQINRKALIWAYTVFWICFVGWGVMTTLVFSNKGSIPMDFVEPVVWVAWWLVTIVHSTVVLMLYGKDM